MATEKLGLESGKRVKAFRAVEEILREDPTLKRVVQNIQSWTGDRADVMAPTTAMMPMIRLTPKVFPNVVATQGTTTAVLGVRVEVFVKGTDSDDIMNLWDAVEDAMVDLKPFRDTTVGCYLNNVLNGAIFDVREPGFKAWETVGASPLHYLSGDGLIAVSFRRKR